MKLISNEDYVQLNGFDEDFRMYYEDVDLCKRAWNWELKWPFILIL